MTQVFNRRCETCRAASHVGRHSFRLQYLRSQCVNCRTDVSSSRAPSRRAMHRPAGRYPVTKPVGLFLLKSLISATRGSSEVPHLRGWIIASTAAPRLGSAAQFAHFFGGREWGFPRYEPPPTQPKTVASGAGRSSGRHVTTPTTSTPWYTWNSSSGSCPARRDFPSEDIKQVWCALKNAARQQLIHLCLRVCANGNLHQRPGLDLPPTKALPKHFFTTLHWLPPQGPRFKTPPFEHVLAGALRCPCRF